MDVAVEIADVFGTESREFCVELAITTTPKRDGDGGAAFPSSSQKTYASYLTVGSRPHAFLVGHFSNEPTKVWDSPSVQLYSAVESKIVSERTTRALHALVHLPTVTELSQFWQVASRRRPTPTPAALTIPVAVVVADTFLAGPPKSAECVLEWIDAALGTELHATHARIVVVSLSACKALNLHTHDMDDADWATLGVDYRPSAPLPPPHEIVRSAFETRVRELGFGAGLILRFVDAGVEFVRDQLMGKPKELASIPVRVEGGAFLSANVVGDNLRAACISGGEVEGRPGQNLPGDAISGWIADVGSSRLRFMAFAEEDSPLTVSVGNEVAATVDLPGRCRAPLVDFESRKVYATSDTRFLNALIDPFESCRLTRALLEGLASPLPDPARDRTLFTRRYTKLHPLIRTVSAFQCRVRACARLRAMFEAPEEWTAVANEGYAVVDRLFAALLGEEVDGGAPPPRPRLEAVVPTLRFCPSTAPPQPEPTPPPRLRAQPTS